MDKSSKGRPGHQARPRSNYAWLWMNPDFADITLTLNIAPSSSAAWVGSPPGLSASAPAFVPGSPRGPCSFPAHQVVLASGSKYFRTRLMRWDGATSGRSEKMNAAGAGHQSQASRRSSNGPGRGYQNTAAAQAQQAASFALGDETSQRAGAGTADRQELCEPCNKQELQATRDVVEFMYTNQLSNTTDVHHLLMMCLVADRWEVPDCIDACMDALTCLPYEGLTVPIINILLNEQPHAVTAHPLYDQLTSMCVMRLRALFSPLHQVVSTHQRLDAFCNLSTAAVQLWLSDTHALTDSENTVAVMLTYWWWHQQELCKACITSDQLQAISSLLRLRQLSTSFLVDVLPTLPWFQPPPDAMRAFKLAHFYPRVSDKGRATSALLQPIPPAWLGSARTPVEMNRARLEWNMSQSVIQGYLDSAQTPQPGCVFQIQGPCLYWGGFVWQFVMCMIHTAQAGDAAGKRRGLVVTLGVRASCALDHSALAMVHTTGGRNASNPGQWVSISAAGVCAVGSSGGGCDSAGTSLVSSPTVAVNGRANGSPHPGSQGAPGAPRSSGFSTRSPAAAPASTRQHSAQTKPTVKQLLAGSSCMGVAAKVTVSCKEAASIGYTLRFTLDAMTGMLCGELLGKPNFFNCVIHDVDDLSPFLVAGKLQLCMQLEGSH